MRIGILTFHCAHNYGAVLQAYALKEYLKGRGHDAEVIDYRPSYITRVYRAMKPLRTEGLPFLRRLRIFVRSLPRRLAFVPAKIVRRHSFERFISERLSLSPERIGDGGRIPAERYDAIVFGSDQIWSPAIMRGWDPVFFGDFPAPAGTLKIAYAASAGDYTVELGNDARFLACLKNFDAISVRESALADVLRPHATKEIPIVLDPTLLVCRDVWSKLAVAPAKREKPYVLAYYIYGGEKRRTAERIARGIAAQLGADVVTVWDADGSRRAALARAETPEEFVGLFKGAACVVTTSFHGTAFSLIFGKPLYFVGDGCVGECRQRYILGELGLLNRIVPAGTTTVPVFSPIDYGNAANARLDALRAKSGEFLAVALGAGK